MKIYIKIQKGDSLGCKICAGCKVDGKCGGSTRCPIWQGIKVMKKLNGLERVELGYDQVLQTSKSLS